MAKRKNRSDQGFMQHSKKLSIWGLIQWVVLAICVIFILLLAEVNSEEASVLSSIVTWSATLAGIVVSTYMGNSSVEKYAAKKFA